MLGTAGEKEMFDFMSGLSRKHFKDAEWADGLEYALWYFLTNADLNKTLDGYETYQLYQFRLANNCWIVWDDEVEEYDAVPIEEWIRHYQSGDW